MKRPGGIWFRGAPDTSRAINATLARATTRRTFSRCRKENGPRARQPEGGGASVFAERIADPSHRLDVARLGGIGLDLVADVADVDVDGALICFERLVVAHQLQELGSRVDAARLGSEVAQQVELGGRQADPLAVARHPATLHVDDQIATAQGAPGLGIGQLAVRAAQQRLDAAHQLTDAEGLDQIIVGTDLEADHLVDLIGPGRQEQDRGTRLAAQPPADLEAIGPRQAYVEQDQVWRYV